LQRAVTSAGFREPRPIQNQTIPAALAGRDVLGLSKTGSGKTAAFALPILERLLAHKRAGPRALIIAPTRELAAQIETHIRALAAFTPIKTVSVFGGVSEKAQIAALRARPEIIVACPGRLLDLWSRGAVDLRAIETLVIDEADHMFDLGFLPDVRRILAALPARRQNLLFSATMPPAIRSFAEKLLHKPHVVELTDSKPASSIDHVVCAVKEEHKVATLHALLRRPDFRSAIVFSRTKRRAKKLADQLGRLGHRSIALQGNMSQPQRQRAMQGFTDGRFQILVATDIAARGIDVAGVSYVVNYDVPWPPEAYTHRIGRTGRAECSGQAFTFATPSDGAEIRAIERMLGAPIPRMELARADGASVSQAKIPRGARSHSGTRHAHGERAGAHRHAQRSNPEAKKRGHRTSPAVHANRHTPSALPKRAHSPSHSAPSASAIPARFSSERHRFSPPNRRWERHADHRRGSGAKA
jgi:ATP-dependent RNA helicase RhlE